MEDLDSDDISDYEEQIGRISNVHNNQKENFTHLVEMFQTLLNSFNSIFPCLECIRERQEPKDKPTLARIDVDMLLIAESLGDMNSDLSRLGHNFQVYGLVFGSTIKDVKNEFWEPAKETSQLLSSVYRKMIEILDKLKDVMEECKNILSTK